MNQNRIDKIGVAAVVNYFCRIGHIDPHITFDDKRAVWDGEIDIYKTEDGCSKKDIVFTLRVQVKSSECKSNNFNTYVVHSVDISDLNLYKNNGGTLFIKVLINKSKAQVYFAYLGKVEINRLISDILEKQMTKDIRCYKAPKEYKELFSQLRTIYLQRIHNLITLEELKDKKGWSFNVTAGPMKKDTNPFDWVATNDTDILVKLPDIDGRFYLSSGPARIFTSHDVDLAVSVEGTEYFSKVTISNNSYGHVLHVDNFIKCQFHDFSHNEEESNIDIVVTPSSEYVDEYLNQFRFLNAIIEYKYFCVGGFRFETSQLILSKNEIDSIKSNISFLEKINSFFEKIGVSNHFNFKNLAKDEYDKLIFLVKLFNDEKPKALPDLKEPYTCFKIGDYNLCFGISKLDNFGFRFYDMNSCTSCRVCDQTQETVKSPVSSYLFENDIFPDNLNYSNIVTEYKKYNVNEGYLMLANYDALRLINKFDSTNNDKFLNAAKDLIEWIISSSTDEDSIYVYKINLLQIHTRLDKPFSNEDKQFLLDIGKYNSNQLDFAASILLMEESRAQSNYNKLTNIEKEEIMQFPIYNLYKKLIDN